MDQSLQTFLNKRPASARSYATVSNAADVVRLCAIAICLSGILSLFTGCQSWQGRPILPMARGGGAAIPPPPMHFNPASSGQLIATSSTQSRGPNATSLQPISNTAAAPGRRTVVPGNHNVRFQSPDDQQGYLPPNENIVPVEMMYQNIDEAHRGSRDVDRANLVADVVITGNQLLETHHIMRNIRTRPGRYFDPDRLQEDVDRLYRLPEIRRINGPYIERSPNGIIVKMEVLERNRVRQVDFVGNRGITDRALQKETGLEDGAPLDIHQIRMARARIEEFYKEKGYPRTQVEILEGDQPEDANVVFLIHEDQRQRFWQAEFEGNSFATDSRLRTFIQSKPGVLKVFGGLVNRDEIEQDVIRLTNYYRKFGFFNARIGREIRESNDGRWLTVRFIIDEGPRYRVRNVSFIGNQAYTSQQLTGLLQLKPGDGTMPDFNASQMNEDVVALRDLYGGEGFVYSTVNAEPRFL
ncbi:MAG: POTRA domain-containing protein [Planctomycetota bacterium]